MAARVERRRDEARLVALAFNDPKQIDKALPHLPPPRHARAAQPWWRRKRGGGV